MTESDDATEARSDEPRARVVAPEGEDSAPAEEGGPDGGAPDAEPGETSRIEEPAKVMRIGGMIKRLLDEVRDAPLDDAARTRLAEIHERSLTELEEGLSPDLVEELHRITLPFSDEGVPSDAELRVAQAQLVGWLEGLFHGIQTALVAQQMAAQAQLSQMRRALPPGAHPAPFGPGGPGGPGEGPAQPGDDRRPSPGQYL
ncbi:MULTISPECIES: bacterial proteasome activator family protein [unclassified Isoptericola]|uniref:bacterial proteasome activator family protein n=1 Tax=unclassified Isoptericola TaxID=2623355 RepID=UPI0036652F1E